MIMKPGLRKFALIAHITVSIGWIGAVVTYLALVVATQTSQDDQTVHVPDTGGVSSRRCVRRHNRKCCYSCLELV